MTPEQVDQAAAALAGARTGQPIPGIPEPLRPQSEADSYAIQDAVLRRLGERVGGWKVGFSPEGGVFCAPIYASRVVASPASLPAKGFHLIGIECEIGFRVNQALPSRAQPGAIGKMLAVGGDRDRRMRQVHSLPVRGGRAIDQGAVGEIVGEHLEAVERAEILVARIDDLDRRMQRHRGQHLVTAVGLAA